MKKIKFFKLLFKYYLCNQDFIMFVTVSAVALLVSIIIFHISHAVLNITAYYANWIGDLIALNFVFICSWCFIFNHTKQQLGIKFTMNLITKLFVIFMLSTSLSFISDEIDYFFPSEDDLFFRENLLTFSKVLLAPFSLILNYLLTSLIIEKVWRRNVNSP